MIDTDMLVRLGFVEDPGRDIWTFGDAVVTDMWPMKYEITERESFGGIIESYRFFVYGFELETVPEIEQVETFVELYSTGML